MTPTQRPERSEPTRAVVYAALSKRHDDGDSIASRDRHQPRVPALIHLRREEFEPGYEPWSSMRYGGRYSAGVPSATSAPAPTRRAGLLVGICSRSWLVVALVARRCFSSTSAYWRKDGSRARQYQCRSYRFSDGTCDAKPVDAEAIDSGVLEGAPAPAAAI